jgi:mannose-1-phosphate guanylyltransferase/MurNAc alpha-1-phosphate uridylyltransferase
VVGEGARVTGTVQRCVVWPGAVVAAGEHLVDAVRTTAGRTVMVRRYSG